MTNTLLYLVPGLVILAVVAVALFRPRRDASRPTLIARAGELRYVTYRNEVYLSSTDIVGALRKAGHQGAADIVLGIARASAAEPNGQQP